ncbi:MAG TPA: SRPBCC family protein [Solimonas sp.]|nr:SRPBCC family protein [Solimonas sp.]
MAEELRFEHVFRQPVAKVFAYFSDHAKLGRLWGARWRQLSPGSDPAYPQGLGSVREVKASAFRWEETVTAFKPLELIEYKITKGAPVKEHIARIAFEKVPGGTKVVYEVRFDPKIPGTGRMFAATMRLGWTIGIPRVTAEMEKES